MSSEATHSEASDTGIEFFRNSANVTIQTLNVQNLGRQNGDGKWNRIAASTQIIPKEHFQIK